jgi:hypothetical protein
VCSLAVGKEQMEPGDVLKIQLIELADKWR